MKKGLALCGGGAKGSYEAGCIKAFDELGIHFDIVTGTSIGALNGAMYCQHDFDRDIELWNRITANMILKFGFNFDRLDILNGIKNNKNSIPFILQYVTNRGADVKPLRKLFDEYLIPTKIQESDVTFGVVTALQGSYKGVEVVANKLSAQEIPDYVLASASAWPVFPVCKIGDKNYIDGGYYDNLPINYCLRLGADNVVAIDLNVVPIHPEYMHVANVKYIKPSHFLGGFMKFDHKHIIDNMTLGYLDTLKAYGKFKGYKQAFYLDDINVNFRSYFNRIVEVYTNVLKNQVKFSKKSENDKNIFDFLAEPTNGKTLNFEDYFILSLETFADLFEVNFYEAHHPVDLLNELAYKLNEVELDERIKKDLSDQKVANKKSDYLDKLNNLSLLKYMFNELISGNHINITLLSLVYASKMKVLVIYLLLEFAMKEGILYDFKKED